MLQREQRVFYISDYSVTEIDPFHVCSIAGNTTESNHTGKLIFFIRGGVIVERIIFYQFNQYVCFYHDIAWKSSWKRLIYIQCSLVLSPPVLSPTWPIAKILVPQFPPLKILRYTAKLSYRRPPQVFRHKGHKTI